MSQDGVIALRAEREEVVRLYASLSDDEWRQPSSCAGWTVHDVLSHLSSLFHPSVSYLGATLRGTPVERTNDRLVAERRSWSGAEVLSEYERWSLRALRLLDIMQRRPLASLPMAMSDLGRHRLHRLADAFAFDHFTHLRFDLVAPDGPIERPALPADPLRLTPAVRWMMALVPPLCSTALPVLDAPVHLVLTGPGGATWALHRTGSALAVDEVGSAGALGEPVATITSSTIDFVAWATHRKPWHDLDVRIDGDPNLGARVADALHVY
jgi:uncharacterized protein (TIGR03083 family)